MRGIFRTRKNKEFSYTPRFYKDQGNSNPYKITGRFDEYRKTLHAEGSLKNKYKSAIREFQEPMDKAVRNRILIILAILILIFLYVIDFDLSIFSINK